MSESAEFPIEISVLELKNLMSSGKTDWVLIDCREPDEHALAAIDGSTLIPMSQWGEVFGGHQAALADKHILVHCHHGGRSMRVTQWLRQNGFPNSQNIAGGIDAWSLEIDPTISRY